MKKRLPLLVKLRDEDNKHDPCVYVYWQDLDDFALVQCLEPFCGEQMPREIVHKIYLKLTHLPA